MQAARDGETAGELEGEQGERTEGLSKRWGGRASFKGTTLRRSHCGRRERIQREVNESDWLGVQVARGECSWRGAEVGTNPWSHQEGPAVGLSIREPNDRGLLCGGLARCRVTAHAGGRD